MERLLIALALLTAPPEDPTKDKAVFAYVPYVEDCRDLALYMELMDDRERIHTLNPLRTSEFVVDINVMRQRYRDFKNVPQTGDIYRFPHWSVVSMQLTLNGEHHTNLLNQMAIAHGFRRFDEEEILERALRETERRATIWSELQNAQTVYYYTHYRRRAIKLLMSEIGEKAYYAGQMPPSVPIEYCIPIGR